MKRTHLLANVFVVLMAIFVMGCSKNKEAGNAAGESKNKTSADKGSAEEVWEGDVPPVLAVCVKGQLLFAPFNEGDLIDEGKVLRQSPQKYTQFIMGEEAYTIAYMEEKNKDLEHDTSYLTSGFTSLIMRISEVESVRSPSCSLILSRICSIRPVLAIEARRVMP